MKQYDCIEPCAIIVKLLVDHGEIDRVTGENRTVIEPILQTLDANAWIENGKIDVERANREYARWRKLTAKP